MSERPELDINVLQNGRREYAHDKKTGFFKGGSASYDWLLHHRVVKDWIDSYTAKNTRQQRMYQFEKVLLAAGLKDPAELLELSDVEAKNLVKRVAQWYAQNGKIVWARQLVTTMKGFYEAHDRELHFKRTERIKTPRAKKLAIEHIPTKAEVFKMVDAAGTLRNRALLLSLFQSGARANSICRWTYSMVGEQLYPDVKVPVQLRITEDVDSKLTGYGLGYYVTFLGEEAAHALKDYVDERKRNGWKPKPKDALFVTDSSSSQDEPLSTGSVWEMVKTVARRAGLNPESIWPHTLRKTFRKVLNSPNVSIDEDTREALMGHKLPGSRGNYFDYHDSQEIAEKYLQADFSRNGGNGRLQSLEQENAKLRDALEKIQKTATWSESQIADIWKHLSGFTVKKH